MKRREKVALCRLLVHGGPEDPGEAQMLNLLKKEGHACPEPLVLGLSSLMGVRVTVLPARISGKVHRTNRRQSPASGI